jgi:hypothetical protein
MEMRTLENEIISVDLNENFFPLVFFLSKGFWGFGEQSLTFVNVLG